MARSFVRIALGVVAATAASMLAGCGSTPPKDPSDELLGATGSAGTTEPTEPIASPPSDGAGSGNGSGSSSGGLTPDQKKQMEIALRRGGEKAAHCAEVVADAPRGEGEVRVLFDGQKGRVVEASVGAPWAGTPAESCIKRAFIGEIVLPFDGDPLEVPYTVKLPPKQGGEAPSGKDGKSGAAEKK